jgi:hypothetical protein
MEIDYLSNRAFRFADEKAARFDALGGRVKFGSQALDQRYGKMDAQRASGEAPDIDILGGSLNGGARRQPVPS